jgi:hypothetical protein
MPKIILLSAVLLATLGLFSQCFANRKTQRAEFLAFPIALFLFAPYPLWAAFGAHGGDLTLVGVMLALGVPSAWLGAQYFQYEWPHRSRILAPEERAALALAGLGIGLLGVSWAWAGASKALGSTAAYFTGCLVVYSFLVKLWKVSRGEQTLDGAQWLPLIALAILYGSMIAYGQSRGVVLLQVAYGFAELCVLAAIAYKLSATRR